MKIEAPKKISSEDYDEDYQDLVDQLALSLNGYLEDVYDALSKKLTITDNINQYIKSFAVTVDSSGKPKTSIKFKSKIDGKTQGMTVIRTLGDEYVESTPFIDFIDSNGNIEVRNIKGLEADKKYTIYVLLLGT